MTLRRSNMLRYSNWTAECIEVLEKSGMQSDAHLSGLCKLQHTAEESATALGLEDHHSRPDLGDIRIQSTLRALDKQLFQWKDKIDWTNLNST
jgi:hypothetical protein